MQQHQTDVLVVGAGPVGMFTALLLAKAGVRTQVIDKEARTAGHSYACGLHPRTLKLLEESGLAGQAMQLGRRINRIAFYAGGKRAGELNLSSLQAEYPFVLVLEQGKLEDLLEESLRRAGVNVQWHHRLSDLTEDSAGVTAAVDRLGSSGKGYAVPSFELGVLQNTEIRASYVVGADGVHSIVRDRLKIKLESAGERQLFAVYEIASDKAPDDEMKIIFEEETTSVMWPFTDEKCRWSFQLVPADESTAFPAKDRTHFIVDEAGGENDSRHRADRLLRDRAPWFAGSVKEVDWRTNIQFEHQLAASFGKGRCWLAGDAAHQTGPVGMQSMNSGLREAADLANALAKILRDQAQKSLLEAYSQTHRAEWRGLLRMDGSPIPAAAAASWVKGNLARIPECLPVSGVDMVALLVQLGLAFA